MPRSFTASNHFYDKVFSSKRHPVAESFVQLSRSQLVTRYSQRHEGIDEADVLEVLRYEPSYMFWAGADLIPFVEKGRQRLAVIELNSCPSGQKSFPFKRDPSEGYEDMLRRSFLPLAERFSECDGEYAVLFDKNEMENRGYAEALANVIEDPVYCVDLRSDQSRLVWEGDVLHVRDDGASVPVKAAFKYVTKDPWTKIPPNSKTFIYNHIAACIGGGRNKLLANKAYEQFNLKQDSDALTIQCPTTIRDVERPELPSVIESFGGTGVIKAPYQNAGRGVHTITSKAELDSFMAEDHGYNTFVVQELLDYEAWGGRSGKAQIGTFPSDEDDVFAMDLRMSVIATENGLEPAYFYVRRAEKPFKATPPQGDSWPMLGTNLSRRVDDGWEYDTDRLIPASYEAFDKTGLSVDDLMEGFIQAALSLISIDKMASKVMDGDDRYQKEFLQGIYEDASFVDELFEL